MNYQMLLHALEQSKQYMENELQHYRSHYRLKTISNARKLNIMFSLSRLVLLLFPHENAALGHY
jgi:hypothetical protein